MGANRSVRDQICCIRETNNRFVASLQRMRMEKKCSFGALINFSDACEANYQLGFIVRFNGGKKMPE